MADETEGSGGLGILSFVGGDGYCVLATGDHGSNAMRWSPAGSEESSSIEPGEPGRAVLESPSGPVEIGWTPAGPMLEFGIGGEGIRAYGVAASITGGSSPDGEGLSGPGVAWELPASGFAALRTIWAANEKGGLILLIAVRPEGGTSHEEELIGAARLLPGAEPYGYAEPLLSTEYDGAGAHVRATLELWAGAEEHVPERGGGQRIGGGAIATRAGRLETARFAWQLDGSQAVGGYEILVP